MQNETEISGDVSDPQGSTAPVETSPTEAPSPKGAETSNGEPSKESLLEYVQKAVEPSKDAKTDNPDDKESPPISEAEDQAAEVEGEDAPKEDALQEEDESLPEETSAKVKKRVNKLLVERRQLRNEVTQLRPAAEIGVNLSQYAQQNNLNSDEVVEALNLAATLKKGDLKGFYEMVSPAVRMAQEQLGYVLPPDLQQRVEMGHMTQEAAHDFARLRYDQQRASAQTQQSQQVAATQAVRAVQADVQRSVSAFEQRLLATDPDYKAIAEPVRRAAQALLFERGGRVKDAQEALAITKRAYDEVKSQYRKLQAPLKATAPSPTGSNPQTPSTRSAAGPKSMLEAMEQARSAMRGG